MAEVPTADGTRDEILHNRIYEQLTDVFEDDHGLMAGYLAYGFYKEAKREWVVEFCEKHGRKPTDVELDAYVSTYTATRLGGLRDEATQALAEYAAAVIEGASPDIREAAITETVRGYFAFSWPKLFGTIGISLLGAAFWSVILLILVVSLRATGVDILEAASSPLVSK